MTAVYGMVNLGDLQPGAIVLVHSAAGGVGQLCMQAVQSVGGKVIATVGNSSKVKEIKKALPVHIPVYI